MKYIDVGGPLCVAHGLHYPEVTIHPSGSNMDIRLDDYPQLRILAWNRPDEQFVDGETALALYERNWRFIEPETLTDVERELIALLVDRYGNGHLLAAGLASTQNWKA